MLNKISKSLIICLTPLQMLIAEKIIEQQCDEFDLLVITVDDNYKYQYYYEKLKVKCNKSYYYVYQRLSVLENVKQFFEFKKNINKKLNFDDYTSIYFASIDSRHCQYVFSKLRMDVKLMTFDDGTANIVKNSIYSYDKSNILKKIIMYLVGVKHSIGSLRKRSIRHYTIYNNIDNVFTNLSFIELMPSTILLNDIRGKEKNIFLGQPIKELFDGNESFDLNFMLEKYNIEDYFPHPREGEGNIRNVNIVKTNLVFEDYIFNIFDQNFSKINVYTFISSAALNIVNINGVEVNFMFNSFLMEKYSEIYNLAKKLGANLVNLDNHE
ncbi:glycosyltransferase family 52 [Acinetobacter guillouiae]|uniref:glycosyltransferase family 52 n=1 Tax=Acinetobacter guillouiae TaxID=106649 RepID=UPI003C6EDDA5